MSDAAAGGQTADVNTALRTFIDALNDSEVYQQFLEADERLQNDSDAMALLREYQAKQQQMQRSFDQSVMAELQELQRELAENETIQHHQAAQSALIELLQETDSVISDTIGRQFAQSTGGGCC